MVWINNVPWVLNALHFSLQSIVYDFQDLPFAMGDYGNISKSPKKITFKKKKKQTILFCGVTGNMYERYGWNIET